MKKLVMSAALAIAALVSSAVSSTAVTYTSEPTELGTFGVTTNGPTASVHFGGTIANADTNFTQTFQFELTSFASTQLASATTTAPFIDNWKIELFKATAEGEATNQNPPGAIGTSAEATFFPTPNPIFQAIGHQASALAAGFYNLVLTGTTTGTNTSYGGDLRLTFGNAPEVPLPGALLLMGTILVGGAGVAKWKKRKERLASA